MKKFLLLMLLTVFAAVPLRAQWSGSADLSTGLGGVTGNKELEIGFLGHLLVQGNASLRYQTDNFNWTTAVNGRWEPKSSDNSRLNFNNPQTDELALDLVYKTVKTRPLQVGVRSDFDWKTAGGHKYATWVSYQYRNDRARNVSNQLTGTLHLDEALIGHYYEEPRELVDRLRLDDMDSHLASCYYELPKQQEHYMGTGARADWRLGEKGLLQGNFSLSTKNSQRHTTWSVFKTTGTSTQDIDLAQAFRAGDASMYRITPNSTDLDFAGDLHYRHTVREDSLHFNWTPGARVKLGHSLDHNSGASLYDIDPDGTYQWRDSLRLQETFNFLFLNAEPFVATEVRWKKIELQADYSVQFYFCRLNDDTHRQPLGFISAYPVGTLRFNWQITDIHKLGVTHLLGVDYPNYLQICWYDRTGGYADQLYRGTADLVSMQRSRYGLNYELKYKRFRYRTDNSITRRINEIDQTWSNQEIEGRLYKVFSWVNSADSWSFGTSHRFAWEGKWLTAGVGVDYNQSRRKAKTDGTIKDASDWRLTMDAKASLGKGWTIGADAKYQSKVATFFSSFNEYWELAAHIQKKFEKVTVYFDGRDLLDNARQSTIISSDGTELLVDVARENRRLFLLGVRWNF